MKLPEGDEALVRLGLAQLVLMQALYPPGMKLGETLSRLLLGVWQQDGKIRIVAVCGAQEFLDWVQEAGLPFSQGPRFEIDRPVEVGQLVDGWGRGASPPSRGHVTEALDEESKRWKKR